MTSQTLPEIDDPDITSSSILDRDLDCPYGYRTTLQNYLSLEERNRKRRQGRPTHAGTTLRNMASKLLDMRSSGILEIWITHFVQSSSAFGYCRAASNVALSTSFNTIFVLSSLLIVSMSRLGVNISDTTRKSLPALSRSIIFPRC